MNIKFLPFPALDSLIGLYLHEGEKKKPLINWTWCVYVIICVCIQVSKWIPATKILFYHPTRTKLQSLLPCFWDTPYSTWLQSSGARNVVHVTEALCPKDTALGGTVPLFCTGIGSTKTFQTLATQIRIKPGISRGPRVTDMKQTPFWLRQWVGLENCLQTLRVEKLSLIFCYCYCLFLYVYVCMNLCI